MSTRAHAGVTASTRRVTWEAWPSSATWAGPDAAVWNALAEQAREPNPFQRPEMLGPALTHLAVDGRVRLLVVTDDRDDVDLVAPIATRQRYRRLPWRVATVWRHAHHFLGTPLVSADLGVDGWRCALDHLDEHGADPVLVLDDIDLAVAQDIVEASRRRGRTAQVLARAGRPVTRRRPTNDYAARQLSGSRRKEMRRRRRRLAEEVGGDLALVDLVSNGRLEEGIESFLRLEAAGWKGLDGGAIDKNPRERSYFVEACRGLARRGRLEILALEGTRGQPVAMAIDLLDGHTRFSTKIAYDERHGQFSPGVLLCLEQLDRFHESDADLLDTCAAPGHPMATRLHPDRRELVTLAVSLHGTHADQMVRATPTLLRLQDRARRRVSGLRPARSRTPS